MFVIEARSLWIYFQTWIKSERSAKKPNPTEQSIADMKVVAAELQAAVDTEALAVIAPDMAVMTEGFMVMAVVSGAKPATIKILREDGSDSKNTMNLRRELLPPERAAETILHHHQLRNEIPRCANQNVRNLK
jgi:hypothetical protein